MRKIILLLTCLLTTSYLVHSQNYVVNETNDTIDANTTWSYDTVFVDASLTILDDITLTIERGAVIMFNGFHKITVQGTLISEGAVGDTIVYTVADTTGYYNFSHVAWDGIELDNSDGSMDDNDTSHFSYCAFYYAREFDNYYGGGVFSLTYYSYAIIENSLFMHNSCYYHGGAIGISYDATALIDHCTFIDNNAVNFDTEDTGGGAIDIGCYEDEEYFDQTIISNCYFKKNKSWYDESYGGGGAVKISGYSDAYVYNNVFDENYCNFTGGAMIVSGHCQPYIVNNLFINNVAEGNGGAVAIKYYAGGYHINNTVVNNYSGNNGGAYSIGCDNDSVYFANNIIGTNTDLDHDYEQIYIDSPDSLMKFYNNDIEGGLGDYDTIVTHANNLDVDPEWLNSSSGDFRLACSSPCIDAGKDTLDYFPELDLAGVPRMAGETYDLGAFETQPAAQADLGEDLEICDGSSAVLDAGAGYETYLWSTTEETQTIEVAAEGTYSVTVTNEYQCESTDEISVTVITCVGIEDVSQNEISVYPNPTNGKMYFESVGKNIQHIKISDITGKTVLNITETEQNNIEIDLSTINNGIYIISIYTDREVFTTKIVKE